MSPVGRYATKAVTHAQ